MGLYEIEQEKNGKQTDFPILSRYYFLFTRIEFDDGWLYARSAIQPHNTAQADPFEHTCFPRYIHTDLITNFLFANWIGYTYPFI